MTNMLRSFFRLTVFTFVLGLFVTPSVADDTGLAATLHNFKVERGKVCQDGHFHTSKGKGATRAKALKAAQRTWMAFTTMEYGTDWGSYAKSANKIVHCSRDAGEDSCTVVARPCKSRGRVRRRHVRYHRKRSRSRYRKRVH